MAEKATVEMVGRQCEEITKTPIAQLVTSTAWGTISFEGARGSLDTIFGVCNQLKGLPMELLPEQELVPIRDQLSNATGLVERIRTFSVEQGNPSGVRDEITNGLRNASNSLYVQSQSRIPFLALQKGDVQRNVEALNDAVQQGKAMLEDARKLLEERKGQFDGIISAAREASASVGVAHFTADFAAESAAHEDTAKKWLAATGVLAVVTMVVAMAIAVFWPISEATVTPHVVQVMTTKLVVLGLLFTATIWCGRLFKTAKHQAAVNKHRSNALKTFQAFVKAAGDDATRNAVLLETTHSIFGAVSSGYLDGTETVQDGPARVLEVVQAASSAAGK